MPAISLMVDDGHAVAIGVWRKDDVHITWTLHTCTANITEGDVAYAAAVNTFKKWNKEAKADGNNMAFTSLAFRDVATIIFQGPIGKRVSESVIHDVT